MFPKSLEGGAAFSAGTVWFVIASIRASYDHWGRCRPFGGLRTDPIVARLTLSQTTPAPEQTRGPTDRIRDLVPQPVSFKSGIPFMGLVRTFSPYYIIHTFIKLTNWYFPFHRDGQEVRVLSILGNYTYSVLYIDLCTSLLSGVSEVYESIYARSLAVSLNHFHHGSYLHPNCPKGWNILLSTGDLDLKRDTCMLWTLCWIRNHVIGDKRVT